MPITAAAAKARTPLIAPSVQPRAQTTTLRRPGASSKI
jgi:hypothetical protein